MKTKNKVFVHRFEAEIQNLNEMCGPDTLEDYIEVLEAVKTKVDKALAEAKDVRDSESKTQKI